MAIDQHLKAKNSIMKLYSKGAFILPIALIFLSGCKQIQLTRPAKTKKPAPLETPVCPPEAKRQPHYLNLAELERGKQYYDALDNKEMAIKYIEEMIKKASDPQQLEHLRLELADNYFELGKFEEANKIYSLYISLYPGSEYRVYAHYQAILCRFYTSLSSDRDQTRTQEALALAQNYLNKAHKEQDSYKEYLDDVINIKKLCCDKLYESDLNIFNFYQNKGSLKACRIHLDQMKKRFQDIAHEDIQIKLLTLECSMAELEKDTTLLALKKSELEGKFPHAPILMASSEPTKKRAITQF